MFAGAGSWVIADVDGKIVLQADNMQYDSGIWSEDVNGEAIGNITKKMNVNLAAAARGERKAGDYVLFLRRRIFRGCI